jgi:hypothetical protein
LDVAGLSVAMGLCIKAAMIGLKYTRPGRIGEWQMNNFGYAELSWTSAKTETRKVLIQRAKSGKDICYSDLVTHISTITFEPHDIRLFHLLGEISTEEHASHCPLLSVMVVHKTGDRQPGPGFFEMASQLGYDVTDSVTFWIQERQRVVSYWQHH